MLYHLYEWQHSAIAPARIAADVGQRMLRHPLNPASYTPAGRAVAASLDMFEHSTRRYGKPAFDLPSTEVDGKTVPITEEILARRSFGQLKHFKRNFKRGEARTEDPRVLVVAPMSGHYASLLRDTVRTLLPDHDVYITDWRDARNVPVYDGLFDLDDYIEYVIEWLEFLGPNTHVMAVCQPSVPVMAAVSLMAAEDHPCQPPTMVLMGGPIDTRINPTEVNQFAEQHALEWFEQRVITRVPFPNGGFMRRVYPGFLQLAGFLAMNLDKHMDAHWDMFQHLVEGDDESLDSKRAFYEEYRSVMDLTAEFYMQTMEVVFKDHHLPRGMMMCRGRAVDPAAISKTALLTIEGERDDISGIGQTKAAHVLCSGLPASMKMHYEQKGVGHYGIFNGGKWRKFIAPRVKEFFRTHGQKSQDQKSKPNGKAFSLSTR